MTTLTMAEQTAVAARLNDRMVAMQDRRLGEVFPELLTLPVLSNTIEQHLHMLQSVAVECGIVPTSEEGLAEMLAHLSSALATLAALAYAVGIEEGDGARAGVPDGDNMGADDVLSFEEFLRAIGATDDGAGEGEEGA